MSGAITLVCDVYPIRTLVSAVSTKKGPSIFHTRSKFQRDRMILVLRSRLGRIQATRICECRHNPQETTSNTFPNHRHERKRSKKTHLGSVGASCHSRSLLAAPARPAIIDTQKFSSAWAVANSITNRRPSTLFLKCSTHVFLN